MTNLQLTEELCGIIERQIKLIGALASRLEELDALSEIERESVDAVENAYYRTIGREETE